MKTTLYIAVIFVCTAFNSASQSLAFAALHMSFKYNIPVSTILQANGNLDSAVMMLSLKELGEVKTA